MPAGVSALSAQFEAGGTAADDHDAVQRCIVVCRRLRQIREDARVGRRMVAMDFFSVGFNREDRRLGFTRRSS